MAMTLEIAMSTGRIVADNGCLKLNERRICHGSVPAKQAAEVARRRVRV
jgi:hypothetical protein